MPTFPRIALLLNFEKLSIAACAWLAALIDARIGFMLQCLHTE